MMDKIMEASLLYDFYGQLLTERKQQVMELYHEENLSLAEIAQEFGISRAAVHESLKSAEKSLAEYEEKLGLVKKFVKSQNAIEKIDSVIDKLIEEHGDKDEELAKELESIKLVINSLE
ncbi:MAG: YlxM family DNA-binding protein [Clostridia bacterium]|nr:YlxM family DNA-binding protein [Clostridia bacterium]MDO5303289.1 YlxM family DNA-binding protein [Clostridia bacterium]